MSDVRAAQPLLRQAGGRLDRPGELGSALRELRDRDLLRDTLAILQESLVIQRRTEQHAASLDRKTGGTTPATPAPVPLP